MCMCLVRQRPHDISLLTCRTDVNVDMPFFYYDNVDMAFLYYDNVDMTFLYYDNVDMTFLYYDSVDMTFVYTHAQTGMCQCLAS